MNTTLIVCILRTITIQLYDRCYSIPPWVQSMPLQCYLKWIILRGKAIDLVCLLLIMVLLQIELCLKPNSLELDFFSNFTITDNKEKLLIYF